MKIPLTKEEAQECKYGNMNGPRKFRTNFCAYPVWRGTRRCMEQCSRDPGHGPGDSYCKQHAKMVEGKK